MGRNKGSIFLSIIVGLAIIGLVSSLVKNPGGFLVSILVMVGFAFVIFMIVRAVMNRRGTGGNSDEMRKYRRAVKQSKKKYNQPEQVQRPRSSRATPLKTKRKRSRRRPHLTVIDGKKSINKQKNNRASN